MLGIINPYFVGGYSCESYWKEWGIGRFEHTYCWSSKVRKKRIEAYIHYPIETLNHKISKSLHDMTDID
jgi:hypothetical protein